ncbi:hypothetical protein GCM10010254_55580 [Streptomyces chromofuscus]|nr:hypothetical protein GCM10010254_55580 [Streptomyces chromofuscus]
MGKTPRSRCRRPPWSEAPGHSRVGTATTSRPRKQPEPAGVAGDAHDYAHAREASHAREGTDAATQATPVTDNDDDERTQQT